MSGTDLIKQLHAKGHQMGDTLRVSKWSVSLLVSVLLVLAGQGAWIVKNVAEANVRIENVDRRIGELGTRLGNLEDLHLKP